MNMKNLIKNEKGQANILILAIFTAILGFALLTIGSYLYFSIAGSADAGQITISNEVKSTGSFAFNGSNFSSDGSLAAPTLTSITLTYGSAVYIFEFNTTTLGSPVVQTTNAILVANTNTNNSLGGATNLSTRINANASAAAIVTASLSGNTTIVTSDLTGTTGNSIVLTETITPVGQAGWIATTTLKNGVNAVTGQSSQNTLNNYVTVTFPLFGLALMILAFGVIMITLKKSFGGGGESR